VNPNIAWTTLLLVSSALCWSAELAIAAETLTVPLASSGLQDGAPADGCRPTLTGLGGPVLWQVTHVAGQSSIAETSRAPIDYRFPICVVDSVSATDVDLSVSFTPLDGKIDRAAGLIFRVKDADNYCVVRANALENNVNLYHVVHGLRWQFAGRDAPVESGKNRRLGVRVEGDLITVSLNSRPLFEARDRTINGPGAVGIWTKAASLTAFNDFAVTILRK
jgi:hypothetical protein